MGCSPQPEYGETPSTAEIFTTPTQYVEEALNNDFLVDQYLDKLNSLEITFWYSFGLAANDPIMEIIDQFNHNNDYQITILPTQFTSEYDLILKMVEALDINELPNIIMSNDFGFLKWNENTIADLSPYYYHQTLGIEKEISPDLTKAIWNENMIGQKLLGIPTPQSGQFVFYNDTWAQELGFNEPPASPEEFEMQACAAAAANGDGTGGWIFNTSASTLLSWIYAFGGEVEIPGLGYSFDNQYTLSAFEFLTELFMNDCAWLPISLSPNISFANRKGLFYTSSITEIPYLERSFEEVGNTDSWTIIPYPSVNGNPVIVTYGASLSIVASTPEEQLASWIFLKYLTEDINQIDWIKVNGYLPTTSSVLEGISSKSPQWVEAANLLKYNKFEPRFQSWGLVRFVLEDAAALIFQDGFDPTTIPQILADLQATADELHAESQ